jgi:hypothetical protein
MSKIEIKKELDNNQAAILLVPNIEYDDVIVDMARQLAGKKICYVTLNKTYSAIKELLELNHVDVKNIIFIDGITKNVKNIADMEDCHFVDSPVKVTELSKNLSTLLKQDFDYLFLDSITNLFTYQGKSSVEYFVQTLVGMLEERGCRGVFFALKGSKSDVYSPIIEIKQSDIFQQRENLPSAGLDIFTSRLSEGIAVIDIVDDESK